MEEKITEYKNKLFKQNLTDDQFYSQLVGYKDALKDSEVEENRLKKIMIESSHQAMTLAEEKAQRDKKIKTRIAEILADERISYKTATVFANSPLALIQWGLETELHTLQKVLGVELTNIKQLRGE